MSDVSSPLSPAALFGLTGRVAIVTGAATGIGAAIAEALAAAGATVLLCGLGDVDGTAADLRTRGMCAEGLHVDVTADDAGARIVATALHRWGRVDIVVANAGAALDTVDTVGAPGGADALHVFDRMIDLHVRSVLRLADAAAEPLAHAKGALIVMSSLSGLRGNRIIAGYGISKAANAQLVRNLAVQWGPRGVRVNALSPGVITTDFAAPITADADIAAGRLARTPLGRFGAPAEVAAAVVWLAAPGGAFTTGQNIVIDGGTIIAD